jgi:hypothetical protein
MTLADLTLPISYEEARQYALVFDAALAQRLGEIQAKYGNPRHIPNALPLVDGRFMLNGDILTECLPGGLLYSGFSQLDATRFDEIAVVPWADAVALLPPDPVEA